MGISIERKGCGEGGACKRPVAGLWELETFMTSLYV